MKDAKDLWIKFDIYETSLDHEMERQSEQVTFCMAVFNLIYIISDKMKKSLARLENINLQHKL